MHFKGVLPSETVKWPVSATAPPNLPWGLITSHVYSLLQIFSEVTEGDEGCFFSQEALMESKCPHSPGIIKLTKCVGENSSIFGMNTMNSEWISKDLAKDFIYGKVQVVRSWQTTPNINFTQHSIHRKYVMIEHKCVYCFAYMAVAKRNHTSNHSIQILFQDLSGWWHF